MRISDSLVYGLRPTMPEVRQDRPSASGVSSQPLVQDGFVASSGLSVSKEASLAETSTSPSALAEPPHVKIKDVQDQLTNNLPGVTVSFASVDEFSELRGRLATMGELKEMMGALYDQSKIPYEYITDGCYARAHMMDEMFRQHGINNAKMFVKGDLEAKNDLMTARWWYHVAPLVFVDGGDGKPIPKVIDPGFVREPMDPEQWVKAMNKGPKVEVDLVDAEQYYPREGRADDNFAESLGPAVGTAQSYSRSLWKIKKGKGLPVPPAWEKPTWDKPGSGGEFTVGGRRETVFPEGINTHRIDEFAGSGATGTLIALEPLPARPPVSAAWDNRPLGAFDPYSA